MVFRRGCYTSNMGPVYCTYCGNQFSRDEHLGMPSPCQTLTSTFANNIHLERHILTRMPWQHHRYLVQAADNL